MPTMMMTGGHAGIGLVAARTLAEPHGCDLILTGRNRERVETAAAIMNKIFHHGEAAWPRRRRQHHRRPLRPLRHRLPRRRLQQPLPQQHPLPRRCGSRADADGVVQRREPKLAKLDRHLLKLLGMDSGLTARKELASELNVHVGVDGTAEENVALHKAVMQKLAENGGKVPDNLKG